MDYHPWRSIPFLSTDDEKPFIIHDVQSPDNSGVPSRTSQCPSLTPMPTQPLVHSMESSESPLSPDIHISMQHSLSQLNPSGSVQINTGDPMSYGVGDEENNFNRNFEDYDAFDRWKSELEEKECVDFIIKEKCSSKGNPPRYKEKVTLLCGRQRIGTQKYVRKCPERTQKTPSRKIEGSGCSASIIYYTYHESPIVNVKYQGEHSHPIGSDNLPFTRKGRKISKKTRKDKTREGFRRANPILNGTAQITEELKSGKSAEVEIDFHIRPSSMGSPEPSSHKQTAQEPRSLGQAKQENVFVQGSSQAPILDDYSSLFSAESTIGYQADAMTKYSTASNITASEQSYYTMTQISDIPQEGSQQSLQPNSQTYHQKSILLTPTSPTHVQHQQVAYVSIPSNQSIPVMNTHLGGTSTGCIPSSEENMHRENTIIGPDISYQYQYEPTSFIPQPASVTPTCSSDDTRWQHIDLLYQHIKKFNRTHTFSQDLSVALESILMRLCQEVANVPTV